MPLCKPFCDGHNSRAHVTNNDSIGLIIIPVHYFTYGSTTSAVGRLRWDLLRSNQEIDRVEDEVFRDRGNRKRAVESRMALQNKKQSKKKTLRFGSDDL